VLSQLPGFCHPDLLVGGDTFDDAGVYRLDSERALVLTVDVLTPIAEDPFVFGQVAAANSLSDVYAMGGTPLAALCVLGFPIGEIDNETIRMILAGVWDKVREAGAVVAGGHTTRDMELKCGLAVFGLVHPGQMFTNAACEPGDVLVLTKPLGSGIITTAARAGRAAPEMVAQANRVMSTLNARAAAIAGECGVRAATDVTGFGLLGHTWQMAQASGVDVVLEARQVPLMPGVFELARQNLFPGGSLRNYEFIRSRAVFAQSVPEELRMLLCDAQTSGGLLLAVRGDRAAEVVSRLRKSGVDEAAVIGDVRAGIGMVRLN